MVVATPYLDEAERCSRIGLMFDGRIVRTGTPKALRTSLGLKRLELRTSDLGETETILHGMPGIADLQRHAARQREAEGSNGVRPRQE